MKAATAAAESWNRATAYERYMGRWSRRLVPGFLRWLDAPPGGRWLDLGCGTGALAAAILASCTPRSLVGVDRSEAFLATARAALPADVHLHPASAEQLPLGDGEVDVTASALVLNFLPDTAAALREMVRVTAPGGLVAACVWDYGGRMDLVRHYWDAATALGLLAPGQDQGERFPICQPRALAAAFTGAGLEAVDTSALEIDLEFEDFEDFWQPFLGGQGSAPAHAVQLAPEARERLRVQLLERLAPGVPAAAGGTIRMRARAWTVRGRVPRAATSLGSRPA